MEVNVASRPKDAQSACGVVRSHELRGGNDAGNEITVDRAHPSHVIAVWRAGGGRCRRCWQVGIDSNAPALPKLYQFFADRFFIHSESVADVEKGLTDRLDQ